MEPRDLLQALMDRDGENSHSLAKKLKDRPGQPQIHKCLKGIAKEPRRSTLQPLADHFGVPIDAFYDPELAERVMRDMGLRPGGPVVLAEDLESAQLLRHLTDMQVQLLRDVEDIPPARRSAFIDQIHRAAEEAREAAAHFASRKAAVTGAAEMSPEERKRVEALRKEDRMSPPASTKRGRA
jgi:hypothetical protein